MQNYSEYVETEISDIQNVVEFFQDKDKKVPNTITKHEMNNDFIIKILYKR